MRSAVMFLILVCGCSALDRERSEAQARLRIYELECQIEDIEMEQCQERRAHARNCPDYCDVAREFHDHTP